MHAARYILLSLLLAVIGCSGNTDLPQDRADRFFGMPLASFGGTDGGNVELQAIAQQLCDAREYDFTPAGFQIAATAAALTSRGHADPRFGGGNGPLEIVNPPDDTIGSVEFAVTSNDPAVSNVTLACSFNLNQAQNTINTPGMTFAVNWRIGFTLDGTTHTLTADQVLYGIDFRST
jgi:hypothetical protein